MNHKDKVIVNKEKKLYKPKQKKPYGRYIMIAIALVMIVYYLVYVNGFVAS